MKRDGEWKTVTWSTYGRDVRRAARALMKLGVQPGQGVSLIGQNSPDLGVVTFRWQGRWATSLVSGDWTNTLGMSFKSGYQDVTKTVDVLDGTGAVTGTEDITLKIKPYYTFDWQTLWNFRKDMSLTAGVLNVFDKAPPLSLATSGTNKGQQFGYDDRYYDPRGRTLYMNLTYKF